MLSFDEASHRKMAQKIVLYKQRKYASFTNLLASDRIYCCLNGWRENEINTLQNILGA